MSGVDQSGQYVSNQTNIAGNQFNAERDIHFHTLGSSATPRNLHQIPEPTPDHVGRGSELQVLLSAFNADDQGAVISSLHGMGGIGKTELARKLAFHLKDRYSDAQINFNFRGTNIHTQVEPITAVELLQHIIRSFCPEQKLPEDVETLCGLYRSTLSGRRALLLIDNANHTAQLLPLIPVPHGCALIVTSRRHLILPGMVAATIGTLTSHEAQTLIANICPAAKNYSAPLAKLCGNLPLALRLAASALQHRFNLRGPVGFDEFATGYIAALQSESTRLGKLDNHLIGAEAQYGIGASMAVSYFALDERHQKFWRALAVFPGSFDEAAAHVVSSVEDPGIAENLLSELLAISMVQCDKGTGRLHLHDLARDYAFAQLSEEEVWEFQLRHAVRFLSVLKGANALVLKGGDEYVRGLLRFDEEWDNIRVAQAWVARNRIFDEGVAALCRAFPGAGIECLGLRLRGRDLIDWLEAAIESADAYGDQETKGIHLGNLANAYFLNGAYRDSVEYSEKALQIARDRGDRAREGSALSALGNAWYGLGDLPRAKDHYKEKLKIDRETNNLRGEGSSLGNLGSLCLEDNEIELAIEYLEEALEISRELGDPKSEECDLGNLGNAYAALGETKDAIACYEDALEIAREIGDRRGEGHALGNLGRIFKSEGNTQLALNLYAKQLGIACELDDRLSEGIALTNMGMAHISLDALVEGKSCFEKAFEILASIESPHAEVARSQLERLR